ncbi:hypothetical protein DFH29DRAFT_259770 [Suillus ampliporus]|nr:hypothetical protein DFH29DRAFT_259770 [Suillus ampliporus]
MTFAQVGWLWLVAAVIPQIQRRKYTHDRSNLCNMLLSMHIMQNRQLYTQKLLVVVWHCKDVPFGILYTLLEPERALITALIAVDRNFYGLFCGPICPSGKMQQRVLWRRRSSRV